MYDVLPDLPRFWFVDADEVVRGGDDVKSIDEDVGGGADDDELGKKCAMVPEDWIVDFKWSFLLGGIVKDVVPVDVGGKSSLNTDF
jgi:hypothetical protein